LKFKTVGMGGDDVIRLYKLKPTVGGRRDAETPITEKEKEKQLRRAFSHGSPLNDNPQANFQRRTVTSKEKGRGGNPNFPAFT